jgi:hypothetical protein
LPPDKRSAATVEQQMRRIFDRVCLNMKEDEAAFSQGPEGVED